MKVIGEMTKDEIFREILFTTWDKSILDEYDWKGFFPLVSINDEGIEIFGVLDKDLKDRYDVCHRYRVYFDEDNECYVKKGEKFPKPKTVVVEWDDLCRSCKIKINKKRREREEILEQRRVDKKFNKWLEEKEKWEAERDKDTEYWKASTKNDHYKKLRTLMDDTLNRMNCLSCEHNTRMEFERSDKRYSSPRYLKLKVKCTGTPRKRWGAEEILILALDSHTRGEWWHGDEKGKKMIRIPWGCFNYLEKDVGENHERE
jgi:hypothetical protein